MPFLAVLACIVYKHESTNSLTHAEIHLFQTELQFCFSLLELLFSYKRQHNGSDDDDAFYVGWKFQPGMFKSARK